MKIKRSWEIIPQNVESKTNKSSELKRPASHNDSGDSWAAKKSVLPFLMLLGKMSLIAGKIVVYDTFVK